MSFSLRPEVPCGRAYAELASGECDLEPPAVHGFQMKRENRWFATVTRIQPMIYFTAYLDLAT
jgi:hypothetical protein